MLTCPVCESHNVAGLAETSDAHRELTSSDIAITNHQYGVTLPLYECKGCSFAFAFPIPPNLTTLYENLEDIEYVESLRPRALEMIHLLEIALKSRPDAQSLLDVGAGAGLLVDAARRHGLQAEGIEPSHWLVLQAKRRFGIDLIQGTFPHEALHERCFDIISIVDVIEHVSRPIELLRSLTPRLASGGIMLVTTPDRDSLCARLLGRRWWHYRLAHVGYFNRRSLARAVGRTDLSITKITRQPWFLPAGYLAKRVAHYLPVGPVTKLVDRWPSVRDFPIRFNFRDSLVVVLEPSTLRLRSGSP